MTQESIENIEIRGDNAVLLIKGMDSWQQEQLAESVKNLWPGKNILFIFDPYGHANIEQIDEESMNAAGWYRKESVDE